MIREVLRQLLIVLFLLICPALAWAEDDFCGSPHGHACPVYAGQVCQCEDHALCLGLAAEKSGPKAPSARRCECPLPLVQVTVPVMEMRFALALRPDRPFDKQPAPSLAPEPPPPRA